MTDSDCHAHAQSTNSHIVHFKMQCGVISINDKEQTVDFNLTLFLEWTDLSIVHGSSHDRYVKVPTEKEPAWVPNFSFLNVKDLQLAEKFFMHNRKTGSVAMFADWNAKINESLELNRFPFDRQICKIVFEADCSMVMFDEHTEMPEMFRKESKYMFYHDSDAWHLDDCAIEVDNNRSNTLCTFAVKAYATRSPTYYLWNIVFVTFLITLCSLAVFVVPQEDVADRVNMILTLMLTIVAFKFVMNSYLPATSYLTFLDKYLLLTWIWLTVLMGYVGTMYFMLPDDREKGHRIDFMIAVAFCGAWTALHLIIVIGASCNCFAHSWEHVKKEDNAGGCTLMDTDTQGMSNRTGIEIIFNDDDGSSEGESDEDSDEDLSPTTTRNGTQHEKSPLIKYDFP